MIELYYTGPTLGDGTVIFLICQMGFSPIKFGPKVCPLTQGLSIINSIIYHL